MHVCATVSLVFHLYSEMLCAVQLMFYWKSSHHLCCQTFTLYGSVSDWSLCNHTLCCFSRFHSFLSGCMKLEIGWLSYVQCDVMVLCERFTSSTAWVLLEITMLLKSVSRGLLVDSFTTHRVEGRLMSVYGLVLHHQAISCISSCYIRIGTRDAEVSVTLTFSSHTFNCLDGMLVLSWLHSCWETTHWD